ncbi:MAG: mechanosensitive ion channel [Bacteroidales bacterium]|nr:mechanosensitive ion channel [Bacteroidales bacterium]
MKLKHVILLGAALLVAVPAVAVFNERNLGQTLHSLRIELKRDYEKRVASEGRFADQYRAQRYEMISIMKKCNELSLMLYSQKQDFTFDLTYALKSVTDEYEDFTRNRLPYDQIANRLEWDIERYARLVESLRRLPPEIDRIDIIPDSLAYHNDSLDVFDRRFRAGMLAPTRRTPQFTGTPRTPQDSARLASMRPYILNDEENIDRDSCIFYAAEMLKMCAARKDRVVADSTHYQRTYLRLKESYDYAQQRYRQLQQRIFVQGQTPYHKIIARFSRQWTRAMQDCREKYGMRHDARVQGSAKGPVQSLIWLLVAILAALFIRLKRHHLRHGLLLYLPMLVSAAAIIGLRIAFLPNSMMNIVFPPMLLIFLVWQFVACLRHGPRTPGLDRILCWISVTVVFASLVVAWLGYIYFGLLMMYWWFFQLAAILSILTVVYLIGFFKEKILDRRIEEYKKKLTFLPAADRDNMLFGVTWIYDLVRMALVPILSLMSISLCIRLAFNIFDFADLYRAVVFTNFVDLTNASGEPILRLSVYGILVAIGLFFIFRFIDYAGYSMFQNIRYATYRKKNGGKIVRKNEINLSLGKSIISAITWILYTIIIIVMLKIPTTSVTIIAGGLSAGIGIALKDIINNFIYGIQLMSGRVRVGDWIECDGVRGRVSSISYQSTQIETIDGAVISFLNASLFNKNFSNLTHNNSYEFIKIVVGVKYGTDVAKVRDVLVEAMQQMRTRDAYGREIVDPQKGIYVVFDEFDESSVNIAVKQYVLVAEHIPYVDKAKEVIYDALNAAGIEIPFPQRDIHIKTEE